MTAGIRAFAPDFSPPSIFRFNSEHSIRIVLRGDEPWFVATDLCAVLGIANNRDALLKLDADEKGVGSTDTLGGQQNLAIVSESGMYTLVLRSRDAVKPGTVPYRFRRWVTREVLPAIRKTGKYEHKHPSPTSFAAVAGRVRRMCSRKQLSFTLRDRDGALINWHVSDDHDFDWDTNVAIGKMWFAEVIELARVDAEEAYLGIRCAALEALRRYRGFGHDYGFFDAMSRWAVAGIVTNPAGLPNVVDWDASAHAADAKIPDLSPIYAKVAPGLVSINDTSDLRDFIARSVPFALLPDLLHLGLERLTEHVSSPASGASRI